MMRLIVLSLVALTAAPAFTQTPAVQRPCAPFVIYNQDPAVSAPLAALTSRTPADYPASMIRWAVEAACTVMFDVDADGKPTGVEARCNATESQTSFGGLGTDYAAQARYFSERAIICSRYEAASAASADERWRTNLMMPLEYRLQDYAGPPDFPAQFERVGAVPITSEQTAHYEGVLTKRNSELAELRADRAAEKAAAEATKATSRSNSKPN